MSSGKVTAVLSGTLFFTQLLIHHNEKPFSRFSIDPDYNIPMYELESANAARLLALNSNFTDKNLGNFLSSIRVFKH